MHHSIITPGYFHRQTCKYPPEGEQEPPNDLLSAHIRVRCQVSLSSELTSVTPSTFWTSELHRGDCAHGLPAGDSLISLHPRAGPGPTASLTGSIYTAAPRLVGKLRQGDAHRTHSQSPGARQWAHHSTASIPRPLADAPAPSRHQTASTHPCRDQVRSGPLL